MSLWFLITTCHLHDVWIFSSWVFHPLSPLITPSYQNFIQAFFISVMLIKSTSQSGAHRRAWELVSRCQVARRIKAHMLTQCSVCTRMSLVMWTWTHWEHSLACGLRPIHLGTHLLPYRMAASLHHTHLGVLPLCLIFPIPACLFWFPSLQWNHDIPFYQFHMFSVWLFWPLFPECVDLFA